MGRRPYSLTCKVCNYKVTAIVEYREGEPFNAPLPEVETMMMHMLMQHPEKLTEASSLPTPAWDDVC